MSLKGRDKGEPVSIHIRSWKKEIKGKILPGAAGGGGARQQPWWGCQGQVSITGRAVLSEMFRKIQAKGLKG